MPEQPAALLKTVPHVGLTASFGEIHRTEDIRFSPSGKMLAVVSTNGSVILFAVDVGARPIQISRCTELQSASLLSPHGIDFLAEDVIAVANRAGRVTFYRIPGVGTWEDRMVVEPIHEMDSAWFGRKGSTRLIEERPVLCGPASVRVSGNHLVIGCNDSSTVTAHPYRLHNGAIESGDGTILAQAGLEIPDGVSLSRDGRWMAVGEHHYRCVVIYRRADMAQTCVLRDADLHHPHGLCFDPTGRLLYVADAGERYVHVFAGARGWDRSANRSVFKLPAVDEDAFRRTKEATPEKYRALEGGIKGIDVDPSGCIVATTCRHQVLRFFETSPLAA